jgi:hypothetical protein
MFRPVEQPLIMMLNVWARKMARQGHKIVATAVVGGDGFEPPTLSV